MLQVLLGTKVHVLTVDDHIFIGELIHVEEDYVTLKATNGNIERGKHVHFPSDNISRIIEVPDGN